MPQDIGLTTTGDIDLTTGDISIGESTYNHQSDLLYSRLGDYRLTPTVPVDSESHLNDDAVDSYFSDVRRKFTADGMKVKSIDITDQHLKINAPYENS